MEVVGGSTRVVGRRSDGREVLLHSVRDPRGEAVRQVSRWAAERGERATGLAVAVGIGGGWHLQALAEWLPDGAVLAVVEPDAAAAAAVLGHVDWPELESGGVAVRFVVGGDTDGLWESLRPLVSAWAQRGIGFFVHPGSLRRDRERYERCLDLLKRYATIAVRSLVTRGVFCRLWVANTVANLRWLTRTGDVGALWGRFAGMEAIVTAAGPSLKASLPAIAQRRPGRLVIAVGTAVKTLLQAGIRPDLVVVIDGREETCGQFEEIDPERLAASWLVSPTTIQPLIVDRFRGRHFLFRCEANRDLNAWLAQFGVAPAVLDTAETVALPAMQLGARLGCTRLFVFGLDLCVGPAGREYVEGSMHDRPDGGGPDDGVAAGGDDRVTIRGNWGRLVSAPRRFAACVDSLTVFAERLAAAGGPELVAVNDGGAAIGGMSLVRPGAWAECCPPYNESPGADDVVTATLAGACRAGGGGFGPEWDAETVLARLRQELEAVAAAARTVVAAGSPGAGNRALVAAAAGLQALIAQGGAILLVQAVLQSGELQRREDTGEAEYTLQIANHAAAAADWLIAQIPGKAPDMPETTPSSG